MFFKGNKQLTPKVHIKILILVERYHNQPMYIIKRDNYNVLS